MKLKHIIMYNLHYILVLVAYFIIGLFLIQYYQYCLIMPDGISYISIAQKYANFDFQNAINGYWGPLFSWCLIPFFLFSSNPVTILYSTKIISLLIGMVLLFGMQRLSHKLGLNEKYSIIVMISSIPMIFLISFIYTTPDLLVTCLLVLYIGVILDPKYYKKISNGILCGIIGSLAYFSKSFAFIFFIAHFILFNLIFYFRSISRYKKRLLLKNFFLGFVVFLLISCVWVALISDKYGYLTIGTSGKYNFELIGPESEGHPVHYYGVIKPINGAISAWEDPTYLEMIEWSPFKDLYYFQYYLEVIFLNLKIIYILSSILEPTILILIISILILLIKSPLNNDYKKKICYLLVTIGLYSGGFCLILVEGRYLLLCYFLIILLGIYLLDISNEIFSLKNRKLIKLNYIFLIFLVCSFVITPIMVLKSSVNSREDVYNLSNTLKDDYNIHGNLASSGEWVGWELTLFLSYYLGCKYYGQLKDNMTNLEINNNLNENNIDYYIVWGTSGNNMQLYDYKEITRDESLSLSTFGKRINIKIFAKNK